MSADGTLHTDRVTMLGFWRGTGARLRVGLNNPPSENGYAFFTRAYGPTTPPADSASELVFQQFPTTAPNKDLAMKFLAEISKPQYQAEFTKYITYGPTNKKAYELGTIEAGYAKRLPSHPDNAARQLAGSSRSSPRSSAKWLRVPAEITMNGPCKSFNALDASTSRT